LLTDDYDAAPRPRLFLSRADKTRTYSEQALLVLVVNRETDGP